MRSSKMLTLVKNSPKTRQGFTIIRENHTIIKLARYNHLDRSIRAMSRSPLVILLLSLLIFGILYLMMVQINRHPRVVTSAAVVSSELSDAMVKIQPTVANDYTACHLPTLDHTPPEFARLYIKKTPHSCDSGKRDWVVCRSSTCDIMDAMSVISENDNITCVFRDIFYNSDANITFGEPLYVTQYYQLIASDFVEAYCMAEKVGYSWHRTLMGTRKINNTEVAYNHQHNVLILGIGSLSRMAFPRQLPKSYTYLVEHLGAKVLEGYNVVGDGTAQAIIPLLTGFTELELPEARKRMRHARPIDEIYPFIWTEYKNRNYVTAFNQDTMREQDIFYPRLNGFHAQPTDFFLQTFYKSIVRDKFNYDKYCYGNKHRYQHMLDYTTDIMIYQTAPKFIFNFLKELSQDNELNDVPMMDDALVTWLMRLKQMSLLSNTILIVMSDHGSQHYKLRSTLQGKQEERLPFMSFTFPKTFIETFPMEYDNFVANTKRLTTPFDVHATLQHILLLDPKHKITKPFLSRDISLFREIPADRSCVSAMIEAHWCACLQKRKYLLNNQFSLKIANAIIDLVNSLTMNRRNMCHALVLEEILDIDKFTPNPDMVRFKESHGVDRSVAGLETETKILRTEFYVKVRSSPNMVFESKVIYDVAKDRFIVSAFDIKVHEHDGCANSVDIILKKFCYCITDTGSAPPLPNNVVTNSTRPREHNILPLTAPGLMH